MGAPSGQHHHPCAIPAVEKFTVVKKDSNLQTDLKHCFNSFFTVQKPWTVEKSFKIKFGKQHFNKYRIFKKKFFCLFDIHLHVLFFQILFYATSSQEEKHFSRHSKAWTTLLLKDNLTLHTEGEKILHLPEFGLKSAEPEKQYTITR